RGRTGSGERIARTARCLPASRWASYLKRPKSINDSMPHARDLVRNKAGFGDIPRPGWYASVRQRSPDYHGASLLSEDLDGKAFCGDVGPHSWQGRVLLPAAGSP